MNQYNVAGCYVHGIGTAVPERYLQCAKSEQFLAKGCINPRSVKLLQKISRLTGIEKRHMVALDYLEPNDGIPPLYQAAAEQPHGPGMGARNALFERGAAPLVLRAISAFSREHLARVGTLVTASCTHASSPGLEQPILAHCPGLASAHRWNLGFMGCSAGLAAMRLVHQTSTAEHASLIVTCELSSLHFQYTDQLDQMTANLLFADGAAAMLISPETSPIRIIDCRCVTLAQYAQQMVWFAGDHGLQLKLSQDLPDTIATSLPGVVADFLRKNGTSTSEVNHWLVHPGGPQILDSVEQSLHLPGDSLHLSRSILERFGNMSSPTILFILKELIESKAVGRAIAMAFGPGLTIELAMLKLGES